MLTMRHLLISVLGKSQIQFGRREMRTSPSSVTTSYFISAYVTQIHIINLAQHHSVVLFTGTSATSAFSILSDIQALQDCERKKKKKKKDCVSQKSSTDNI